MFRARTLSHTAVGPRRPAGARLLAEALESRLVPSTLEIQLIPDVDAFGNQFETVQVYRNDDGLGDRVTFGIFDTGASPITYGAEDQALFEFAEQPIPTIDGAEVTAEGVGGSLTGLVSEPGTILADGMHALDLDALLNGGESIDLSGAAAAAGVQAMIGTEEGSPDLPTITGTPILNGTLPGATTPGVAVLIDQEAYTIDFGALFPDMPEYQGLVLSMPDLSFVAPGTNLTPAADGSTTEVCRLPITPLGIDNHLAPGDTITESYNPTVLGVTAGNTAGGSPVAVGGQRFLFDTGAQLSIVSTALALQLGLDLDHPDVTIDVGGAGGTTTVGGYTIDSLVLPRDDDNDGVIDGELIFRNVPVFVLDLDPSIDGILGMNLFNPAAQMLYDPWDPDGAGPAGPSLQVTFSTAPRDAVDPDSLTALDQLFPSFAGSVSGHSIPNFQIAAPAVTSIDRTTPAGPATNATSVTFTVTFGEAVTGVDATDFDLVTSGVTAGPVVVAGSGSVYTVTVSGITGDGTLGLNLVDDDSIVGGGGIPLGGVGAGNGNFTGQVYTIDTTPPAVADIARAVPTASLTSAAGVQFVVTFSEPVTGVDAADFALTTTGVTGAAVTAVSGAGASYTVTVATGSGDGTIRLDLADDDTIADAVGNPLGGTGAGNGTFTGGETYTLDRTAPQVQSVTRLDPAVTNLGSVRFLVAFSEPVSQVGADDFALVTAGVTGVAITGVTGSGDTYTVTVGTGTGSGTIGLNVAAANVVTDAAGNPMAAGFSGPAYTIDTSGPTATVGPAAGQPGTTNAQPLRFAVTFDGPVTGFGPGSVALDGTAGGLAGATVTVTNPGGDGETFEVAVSGLTGDGTVHLSVPVGAVTDALGNPNSASSGTAVVTLDTIPPAVSAPDLAAASDSGTSDADDLTGDTTPTFTGTAEAGVSVDLFDGATLLGHATAAGGTWAITAPELGGGVHTVFARATDAAGNTADAPPLTVTIDTAGPTVAVTRAPGQPAAAAATDPDFTLSFTVTFSQPVTGLTASGLVVTGPAGGTVRGVTGAGAAYTVTVSGLAGPGTVGLSVTAGAAADAAGNPTAGSGGGETVGVTFATRTAVAVSPAAPAAGGTVVVTAAVSAPAGGTVLPTGTVGFVLTGPDGTVRRSAGVGGGVAQAAFDQLAPGHYTVGADYAGGAGFLAGGAAAAFDVPAPPAAPQVGQNTTGVHAAAAGATVTVFDSGGHATGTLVPFPPAEVPGGVRVAVADVTGDGTPDVAVVPGPGSPAQLRVIDGKTGAVVLSVGLFEGFAGGVFVAAGDLNGDGRADLVVTPNQGGGPRVTVFSGADGTVLANFFGIDDPNFRGGARAAVGDLDGDGVADLVVSAGFGGGPRLSVFDGAALALGRLVHPVADFFLFDPGLRNGAYVAVGDVDGDGFGDIVGGAGPGGGPRVLVVSGRLLLTATPAGAVGAPLANFFAGNTDNRGGIRVVVKDLDGDTRADVVVGDGEGGGSRLTAYAGKDFAGGTAPELFAVETAPGSLSGVFVG